MVASDATEIRLLPHQYEFVRSASPWVLTDGGRGSGKTRALAIKLAARAGVPGAREGLFRQRLIDLRTTTLRSLLEGDGYAPPVLMPGSYTHNQQLKTITLHGGGTIVYNGMDQGDVGRQAGSTGRGSSMNLSGAAFDEAVEMTEHAVVQVAMSVRLKIDGLPLQRYLACNPGPPSHWLAKRFGLAAGNAPKVGHTRIPAPAGANWHLPAEFLAELRGLEGVARERYWLGKWVGSDGLVYDLWDRAVHAVDSYAEPARVVVGVDYGYTDPFAAVRVELDADRRAHVASEVYQTRMQQSDMIDAVRSIADGADAVYYDSAAPQLGQAMRDAGLPAAPCRKGPGSINAGILRVSQRLRVADDGRPRLTVSPNCTHTIGEFESYEWRESNGNLRDAPRDLNNHAMDAIRYAVAEIDAERAVVPPASAWAQPEQSDPLRAWYTGGDAWGG